MSEKKVSVLEYYQEKMIEFSDRDHKNISYCKAKEILGRMFRLPEWLQIRTINDMINTNLLVRKGQRDLGIISS